MRSLVSAQLREIIDEAAEQMRDLSHFEEKAAAVIAEEIVAEEDVTVKVSKLLHVLLDEISTLKMSSLQNSTSDIAVLYAMVAKRFRNVPDDATAFVPWLCGKIGDLQKQVKRLQTSSSNDANEKSVEQLLCEKERSLEERFREKERALEERFREKEARMKSAFRAELGKGSEGKAVESDEKRRALKAEVARLKSILAVAAKKYRDVKQEVLRLKASEVDSSSGLPEIAGMTSQISNFKSAMSSLKEQLRVHNDSNEQVDCRERVVALERRIESLKARNNELEQRSDIVPESDDLRKMNERVSILVGELRSCKEENSRLAIALDQAKESSCASTRSVDRLSIDNASLTSKLADSKAVNQQISNELEYMTRESARLRAECVRADAKASRLRDESNTLSAKCGAVGDEAMNLKRFGFSLADALCQRFDPTHIDCELHRLLAIARNEHIEFSERVPLNPYNCEVCRVGNTQFHRIHSEFENIEHEISMLQAQTVL